ncbi:MAG: S8 family serine peptidase [Bdellovibrio sp.]|nr:S8 family serine peptidase [Bdellovibrio sp.]
MNVKTIKHIIFFVSMFGLAACTKDSKNQLNPLLKDSQNIISTRPQNSSQLIAILKLKNPALLENATMTNGKPVVDAKLLAAILKEQDEFIKALKELSTEIQVIYRYKMVLNGLAILAPIELAEKLKTLGEITSVETAGNFLPPKTMELSNSVLAPIFKDRNSAKFVGAEKLNQMGITGKGISVGIIDTGIDYTHAMFHGIGTEEAYKAVNPSGPAVGFPNDRVVGGIDLVGTAYDSASPDFSLHIPKPDMNPLDEAGHGSHVAGTVAGLGDGVNTYNGMAPEAVLHAIKVFGANGSTSDTVVIAALEYAADPNADGDAKDSLDIVNMSLGSGYGNPHIMYTEAIKNLVAGGTMVIASAGNSGHKDYITGAPGTSDDAFSVAASVDDGNQNWKFDSSKIHLGADNLLVEAVEAATSKPIAEAGNVTGKLVFIGLADKELTADQIAAVSGNVALIDRGIVEFNMKVKRAQDAGAIGVVVADHSPGSPTKMGTRDEFKIPAIMITLENGKKIKAAMALGVEATIEFQAAEKIEKPELIDTLTSFTSKGPRSTDGFIKPEISAPGSNVISAKMGGGAKAVQMSGTSMAAPHMSGIMALVKQAHPTLSAYELKSVAMGTAKTIGEKGERYAISLQGSGRVQADQAALSPMVAAEASISIGETAVESKKSVRRVLHLKNLSKADLQLTAVFEGNGFITMTSDSSVTVKAGAASEFGVVLTLDASAMKDESIREMDGWIKFMNGQEEVYRIPVLAIAHKLSAIQAMDLVVQATSARDADGALAKLTLNNANQNVGEALLFNLIGQDDRKPAASNYMSADCDLQSAGYRIVTRKDEKNVDQDILQVAIKTFKPMTTWNSCDISILIDANGDGIADQELLGSSLASLPGQKTEAFASTLLDAAKAREIRKEYEAKVVAAKNDPVKLAALKGTENYDAAVIDQQGFTIYNNSSVVIVEALVSSLAHNAEGNLAFKVLTSHNEQSSVQMDDYLADTLTTDRQISLKKADQAFVNLPETVSLTASETKVLDLTKGFGNESLLVLMPQNKFSASDLYTDAQAQVVKATYKP